MKIISTKILRLMDANLNRAVEGIRVAEETARMLCNDYELTSLIKKVRHDLVNITKGDKKLTLPMLFARDSEKDVLREGETASEKTRTDILSVVMANAGRAQEAVRSLEEFSKLVQPSLSGHYKNIRFTLYDIEKKLITRLHVRELLTRERLQIYVILENKNRESVLIDEHIKAVLDAGAGTVLYKDCSGDDSVILGNTEKVMNAFSGQDSTVLVENRVDLAMICGTDGIHLGWNSIPAPVCRKALGQAYVIGADVVRDSFKRNTVDALDYVLLDLSNNSIDLNSLIQVVRHTAVPVVLAGAVTDRDIETVLKCGVTGIAVTISCDQPTVDTTALCRIKKYLEMTKHDNL